MLKNILIITIILMSVFANAQEYLSVLKYNQLLLNNTNNNNNELEKSSSALHNTIIYAFDTLHLPFIDDFSKDKYKVFDAEIGDANVSDTTWYKLDSSGTPLPLSRTYMTDTTYRYNYDTIPGFGTDSLSVDTIALLSTNITVYDLDFYPITSSSVEVWPNTTIYDSLWTVSSAYVSVSVNPDLDQDTVTIYFADTTSVDINYLWKDIFTYRNSTLPINPISIGVASFDGIDENGYPYDWSSSSAYGVADYLTSKPIFLQNDASGGTYNIADSIYLSFLYQAGGLGEMPDSQDSLVLEFYSVISSAWNNIWSISGSQADTVWKSVNILLDEQDYFQDGFQFRFKNYGSLTGSLDHWHIDYVILDDFRSYDDTAMNDWAFQNPFRSMLIDFTSMPWSHYIQVPFSYIKDTAIVNTYNSYNGAKFFQPASLDLLFDNNIINSIPYAPSSPNVPALSSFDMIYPINSTFFFDTSYADTFATFELKFNLSTNTTPERLNENDTLYFNQVFNNYYAYDDASAEAAYGLVSSGAELAYKFTLPSGIQDSIKSVFIHFQASVNNASTDPFFIQIWDDIGGQPGNLIYTTDDLNLPITYIPEYNIGVNGFYEYVLPEKVSVSGTYYIGLKQSSANRLNIGFDKNINNNDKIFYNLGSGWNNTGFEGSLMMRPVFISDMDAVFASVEPHKKFNFSFYPNPVKGILNIEVFSSDAKYSIYDYSGRLIIQGNINNKKQVDISSYNNGLYILSLISNEGDVSYSKFIVSH